MLVVFGKQRKSLLSPTKRKNTLMVTPEEESFLASLLDNLYSSLPRRQRGYVQEHMFGGGGNGIAYLASDRHQVATDGDVSVFFKGSLRNPLEDIEEASYILQKYEDDWCTDIVRERPNFSALQVFQGPFAFVLFDRSCLRIVAGRDAGGEEPLYWGSALLSDGLLFASDRSLIEADTADAAAFPPGMVFVSHEADTAGDLVPMAPATRPPSVADMCRVESTGDIASLPLHKTASHPQLSAA
ncbi:hypothetical protein ACKKBG_A13425 [Auxenochlorella protothecoides x Auxenochlorella symbiontica]